MLTVSGLADPEVPSTVTWTQLFTVSYKRPDISTSTYRIEGLPDVELWLFLSTSRVGTGVVQGQHLSSEQVIAGFDVGGNNTGLGSVGQSQSI
jgi:hypothetical protein